MIENESAENYLEMILILSKKLPVVRSVDIANELGFKKPSVSIAMKNLREKNYITVTEAGFIYLTDSGSKIAQMVISHILPNINYSCCLAKMTVTVQPCKIEYTKCRWELAHIRHFVYSIL